MKDLKKLEVNMITMLILIMFSLYKKKKEKTVNNSINKNNSYPIR